MELPIWYILYKWDPTICGLLCLLSLIIIFSSFMLLPSFYNSWFILHCMDILHFCLSIHQLIGSWVVLTWVDYEKCYYGHLCTSFWVNMFSILFIYLAVELQSYYNSAFNFLRKCQLFFTVAIPFFILISNIRDFKFLYNNCYFPLFFVIVILVDVKW